MITALQADATIGPPAGIDTIEDYSADTQDIIDLIIWADCHAWKDTEEFSRGFEPTAQSMYDLWYFVRTQIEYVVDPPGKQFIKSPAQVWEDKTADCKSMSIFIASVIHNIARRGHDISYDYDFVGYDGDQTETHVYPAVILPTGQEIIMDAVHTEWNEEVPYAFKRSVAGCKDNAEVEDRVEGIRGVDRVKWMQWVQPIGAVLVSWIIIKKIVR